MLHSRVSLISFNASTDLIDQKIIYKPQGFVKQREVPKFIMEIWS